jgi:hypothetical protein
LRAEYAPQFGPREEARQFPSKDEAQRFLSQYGLKGFDIVSLLDPKA